MPNLKRLAVYDLFRNRAPTIGVLVYKPDHSILPEMLRGIQKVTAENGCDVLFVHSEGGPEKDAACARLLIDRGVDGLLISLPDESSSHFTAFPDKDIPIVFFGAAARMGGYVATEHLLRQGCRRIVLVTASGSECGSRQYRGMQEAMKRRDRGIRGEWLISGDMGAEGGEVIAERVLRMEPRPDGLFITDDPAAVACLHRLTEVGLRIPGDVAIVGLNNDPIGRLVTPTLTTLEYPGFEIGRTAASNLLDQLTGHRAAGRRILATVPPALIVRSSSLSIK